MANLKELRGRVKSITSTQKITKAMQVVSAAKLKKVKDQAEKGNIFSSELGKIMQDITRSDYLGDMKRSEFKFFSKDLYEKPNLLIVMTSDRGLCGSFNSGTVKKVKSDINRMKKDGKAIKLLLIGTKANDMLKRKYSDLIIENYPKSAVSEECMAIQSSEKIMQMIKNDEVGACYIYYNQFKNAMTQILTRQQLLPFEYKNTEEYASSKEETNNKVSKFDYEGLSLIKELVNLYITGSIKYAILQSKASEEGSRMTAMDNATRNAGDLIDELTLKLNRSRQAIITTELTEIISGAEAQ